MINFIGFCIGFPNNAIVKFEWRFRNITMATAYQKVVEFCETFGHKTYDEPRCDVPDDLITLRLKLIDEEIRELGEAFATRNFVEVVDALADITVVTLGMGATFGINMDHSKFVFRDSSSDVWETDPESIQDLIDDVRSFYNTLNEYYNL